MGQLSYLTLPFLRFRQAPKLLRTFQAIRLRDWGLKLFLNIFLIFFKFDHVFLNLHLNQTLLRMASKREPKRRDEKLWGTRRHWWAPRVLEKFPSDSTRGMCRRCIGSTRPGVHCAIFHGDRWCSTGWQLSTGLLNFLTNGPSWESWKKIPHDIFYFEFLVTSSSIGTKWKLRIIILFSFVDRFLNTLLHLKTFAEGDKNARRRGPVVPVLLLGNASATRSPPSRLEWELATCAALFMPHRRSHRSQNSLLIRRITSYQRSPCQPDLIIPSISTVLFE